MLTSALLANSKPYDRPLEGGLRLRSLRDERDAERLITFNLNSFGAGVDGMTRALMMQHPDTRPEHWLFIEDEASGQIVSSLALLPWTWKYEDVSLKVGEMGIVSTLGAYRNRGLVRILVGRFKELLREQDFDLSQIQGIPYFYRQFGYEYALPLEATRNIELRDIPDAADGEEPRYRFRAATVDDIPALLRMYDEAATTLDIRTVRSEDVWRFMFTQTQGTAIAGETWVLLNNAQIVGYWRLTEHGFGNGLIVSETSRLSNRQAEALLRELKRIAIERAKPYLRMNLPANNDLINVAKGWSARDGGAYQWQIHVVDAARLLRKLTPVLERRIAGSLYAGLSQTVCINLYREAIDLHFDGGKLTKVESVGFKDGGEIRLPPMQFTPLVLGWRSREELASCYPDVSIWGQAQNLVDVLFPPMRSFIYTNY